MLKKKEDKHETVNDEVYYALKIDELRAKLKNISLVANDMDESDDIY